MTVPDNITLTVEMRGIDIHGEEHALVQDFKIQPEGSDYDDWDCETDALRVWKKQQARPHNPTV